MNPLIGAGIGLFGGLLNNIFASDMQDDQQAFNAQQSALAAQFNAQQAEANRSFQGQQADASRIFTRDFGREMADRSTEFSNTSWQRGVADMRAAGINPILAASKGGASSGIFSGGSSGTPSGAQASMQAASSSIGQVFDLVGPALSTAKAVQEIENMKTSNELTKKNILSETERPPLIRAQSGKTEAERDVERERIDPARYESLVAKVKQELITDDAFKALIKAGAVGDQASKITGPVSEMVSSAVKGLLGASTAKTQSLDRTIKRDTFEDRFGVKPGGF